MNQKEIVLKMYAAFQGWGAPGSSYKYRPVSDYPTKSGIVGMIGASLGILNSQEDKLINLGKQLEIEIDYEKSDKGTLVTDFQVVNGNQVTAKKYNLPLYYNEDGLVIYPLLKTSADNKERMDPIVIYKEYRANATYYVKVKGDSKLIDDIIYSLYHPCFPIYFGKKCCIGNLDIFY